MTGSFPTLRIEVILCTYNGAAFIAEQIETIFDQHTQVDLISVYDDQSKDETVNIVRRIVAARQGARPLIRLRINEANLGYASNFASAIAAAEGDVIFLCDQDDRWRADKVSVAMELLQATRADMVFSDGVLVDSAGQKLSNGTVLANYGLDASQLHKFGRDPISYLVRRNYINGAAMAIRRDAAKAALPVPSVMPHDYWLAIWCALHGGIVASAETLYEYRQHGGNAIGVGIHRWHHQWYGIWRNPQPPRLRELAIVSAIASRTRGLPTASVFDDKLRWLRKCLVEGSRFARLVAIVSSMWMGAYRRFGVPYAFARDVMSALRSSR